MSDTLQGTDTPAVAKRPRPWASRNPAKPRTDAPEPPKTIVARRAIGVWLGKWLRENWFYAISAVSLALAGIFLVQNGMDQGYFPPVARVVAAVLFGLILIVAGEVIRRRFGDTRESTTAYLPSVFSGAGIVSLFGAVLAAHLLLVSWGQTAHNAFPVFPEPEKVPEPPMALEPSMILALATVVTVAAGWRRLVGGAMRLGNQSFRPVPWRF